MIAVGGGNVLLALRQPYQRYYSHDDFKIFSPSKISRYYGARGSIIRVIITIGHRKGTFKKILRIILEDKFIN